jgi:hypothetical protein
MNNNRTFGIEIECIGNVSMDRMASIISRAFRANDINMTISVSGYRHDRGDNPTNWVIKPDGSVRSIDGYSYPQEIISPVLKGRDGLKALEVVCDAIADHVAINKSCGLHVHHGIEMSEDIRLLVNAWIDHEKFWFNCLPASRATNTFSPRWNRAGVRLTKMHTGTAGYEARKTQTRNWYGQQIGSRRASMNIEGWLFRGAVEFRLHSGTTEFDKMKPWLVATQRFVDKALNGDFVDFTAADFDGMVAKLQESSNDSDAETVTTNVTNSNSFIHPDAKKKRLPKAGTKLGYIANRLLDGDFTKAQIAEGLEGEFGPATGRTTYEFQVGCKIADFASLKYGFGWNVVERSGRYYVEQTQVTTVNRPDTDSRYVQSALNWMVSRRDHFSG